MAYRAASRIAPVGAINAARAVTPPTRGLSSSSSSSDDRPKFYELVYGADEACRRFFDATHEVNLLERYLEAVRVALEASEREIAAMQAVAADT